MKRQNYSKKFKLQVVKEALETGNKALVSRCYELSTNMYGSSLGSRVQSRRI
ncbi:MAG: hypothetical protein ACQEWV_15365 [Bacillota bacterium]